MADHEADAERGVDDDHAGHGDDEDHAEFSHERSEDLRVTSPMQPFTTSEVGVGFAVLLVGLVVAVGLPLLLT